MAPRRTPKKQAGKDGSVEGLEHVGHEVTGRRRFLGYLVAAPTLLAAAQLGEQALDPPEADALPSNPQVGDAFDLEDLLTAAALPTSHLIAIKVGKDGTASFALPRAEVGQGITTAMSMLIAEEMDLPLEKVHVTLADARPELLFNQLTGGSNTVNSLYKPVRVAAALAKGKLMDAAAAELGDAVSTLTSKAGLVISTAGQRLSYGDLAEKAASQHTKRASVHVKDESKFEIVGKPTKRVDALEAVTGRKQFTLDLKVPDALPTMIARPPTINGTVKSVNNADKVRDMPGITDVAKIESGVAVRGRTFGQCIDAVRALEVSWGKGPVDGESDDKVERELKDANVPLVVPGVPLATVVEDEYTFAFASNSALEPGAAIADVKNGKAEIWSSLKAPIAAQGEIAQHLGIPQTAVTIHVVEGGGSFGRELFHDDAMDAAEASKAMGKPVRLMWHRTDEFRQGRAHPMSYAKIRANVLHGNVVSFEQHHSSVRTSFSHGFGEVIAENLTRAPLAGLTVSEAIFETTQMVPYSFGVSKQLLVETHQSPSENQYRGGFPTGSMRNVYSPNVVTAHELFADKLAAKVGKDQYTFRRDYAKDKHLRTVVDKAAELGGWDKPLPKGFGRGFGLHREYKQTICAFIELDCRQETVDRDVREAWTGPRVTKAVVVTMPSTMVVNPLGMEAQLEGGAMDGIALALTSSLHLKDGYYYEGSWDEYFYTRQWNCPKDMHIEILSPDKNEKISGSGEASVAPTMAATACAYAAATGKQPKFFPINHKDKDLGFEPMPTEPSVPQSPTDGLDYAF